MTPITIRYPWRPRRRSLAAAEVADLFGLAEAPEAHVIADGVSLDLQPRDLVLFTGPSGSGKSSLWRAAAAQLNAVDANALALSDEPLIDALSGSVSARLGLLSACGLAEPRLSLRTPGELSDGQRARFRLAIALDRAAGRPIAVDEFAALLDRPLARVLAYNLRRLVSRTGVGALVATSHSDICDELNPDVLVECRGDGDVTVTRRDVKKKAPASSTKYGSPTVPAPTGRTSLGGITAATASASSAKSSCSGMATSRSASACSRRPRRA